jgi:hypothetical protein
VFADVTHDAQHSNTRLRPAQEASLSNAVWLSLAMADARRLRPFTNDLASDENRLIAIQRSNNAGEVLNKDDFPEAIWGSKERGATTFKTLPDLFYGYGYWVVSDRCADVLRGFDLGSGSLHPVKVFEKDKVTPIGDHGWFCWNFGNKKNVFLPDKSKNISPFSGNRWHPRATLRDNEIAVSPQALIGPDIWIDPLLFNSLFLSDALVKALKKAKCTSGFSLKKCQVVN